VLQCAAVRYSALQCVVVCFSVLQCVVVQTPPSARLRKQCALQVSQRCAAVYYSVWQCVAVSCNVLQCVAVRCSALQCVAVRCSVLQRIAVSPTSSMKVPVLTVCTPFSSTTTRTVTSYNMGNLSEDRERGGRGRRRRKISGRGGGPCVGMLIYMCDMYIHVCEMTH